MNANQLQHGLIQLLQHYQRSGIHYFERNTSFEIPKEWTAALQPSQTDSSSVQQAVHSPAPVSVEPTPSRTAPLSPSPEPIANAETAPATPVRSSAAPVGVRGIAGDWSLPQLSAEEKSGLLQAIATECSACRKCQEIVTYRRQTVPGEGNLNPKIAFFGEAPGADEDAQGRPFVGAAGQLLTNIIGAMKLKREDVYILNTLKCRPPQNRTPLPDEIANCFPFAERQLDILQPDYIILLGAVAVRAVLQSTEPVGRLRGRFHQYRRSKVLVTYHPAYLLRNPAAKKLVWEDVKLVMKELGLG